jgi:hypothetical protein
MTIAWPLSIMRAWGRCRDRPTVCSGQSRLMSLRLVRDQRVASWPAVSSVPRAAPPVEELRAAEKIANEQVQLDDSSLGDMPSIPWANPSLPYPYPRDGYLLFLERMTFGWMATDAVVAAWQRCYRGGNNCFDERLYKSRGIACRLLSEDEIVDASLRAPPKPKTCTRADSCTAANGAGLFNHLVGAGE